MLSPTRKSLAAKNSHHSSSRSVPLVCRAFWMRMPGRLYFCCRATASRNQSSPIKVGSPPCQAKVTSGTFWASMYCRVYSSSRSSGMRKSEPG